MPFNRTCSCVAIGLLLLLLATPSFGQGLQGLQIFAPADLSTFGGGYKPNEGYFFQFDGLYWSISPPRTALVGATGTREVWYGPEDGDMRIQSSSLDTGFLTSEFSAGNRIEFGRVEDRNGWFVSIYQLRDQVQNYTAPGADMVLDDPGFGPGSSHLLNGYVGDDPVTEDPVYRDLPVTFYDLLLQNEVNTWGVEANYLHRFLTRHAGGTFELFLGVRYYEFNDAFFVHAGTGPVSEDGEELLTVPSFLGGSSWYTSADNHVVGPQIGLRWFKKRGRWMLSTEGRFMAGFNSQTVQQQVDMGPNLNPGGNGEEETLFQPRTLSHTGATYVEHAQEWSPTIELRLEARYQITRAISFHAGWTGTWMDGIARANGLITYAIANGPGGPPMGIDMTGNRQGVFINGLTLGFDINR